MKKRNRKIVFLGSILLIITVGFFYFPEENIIYTKQKEYYTGVIEDNNSTNYYNISGSSSFQIIETDEEITVVDSETKEDTSIISEEKKDSFNDYNVNYEEENVYSYDIEEEEPEELVEVEDEEDTTTTTSKKTNTTKKKNGWYTKNGKKYYYKNGKKLTNTYVDYIYLNSNGVAQAKIGHFSATLYGARAWANQPLNIRKKANYSSKLIGNIPTGGKMVILSEENSNTKYIKVKYNGIIGYVYSEYIYINLPDVIPDAVYRITNASNSIYKTAGKKIPGVTGQNLYGYTKKYNAKIGKNTYYAPLLYPVAKQLQRAYNKARKQGYNLKIYDTYRPYDVSVKINRSFRNLYNSNKSVKKTINYDKSGQYWGPTWFLANSVSRHNRATALDLTLTDENNRELSAQTPMHTLDTRSLRKYNNSVAKKLSSIMTSAGFETLKSEWWHFQEDNYKSSPYTSFKVR